MSRGRWKFDDATIEAVKRELRKRVPENWISKRFGISQQYVSSIRQDMLKTSKIKK